MNHPPDPPDLLLSTPPPLLIMRSYCVFDSITSFAHALQSFPPTFRHSPFHPCPFRLWVQNDGLSMSMGRIQLQIVVPLQLQAVYQSVAPLFMVMPLCTSFLVGVPCTPRVHAEPLYLASCLRICAEMVSCAWFYIVMAVKHESVLVQAMLKTGKISKGSQAFRTSKMAQVSFLSFFFFVFTLSGYSSLKSCLIHCCSLDPIFSIFVRFLTNFLELLFEKFILISLS